MRKLLTALVAAAMSVALIGCDLDSDPASGSGANIVDDNGDTDDDTDVGDTSDNGDDDSDEPDTSAFGTRDNPLAVGTRITMGDWELAVVEVTLDATDAIMEENQFNDPPADGRQFVMWRVEATYTGDDSGEAWLDFSWAIVGSAGNTFGTSMDDYCGSIPEALDETGETFPGGQVAGNVCVSVASDQIAGATIRVEELMSFEDTRAFYAVD